MSKLVELYVQEIQRPNSGVTIEHVPPRLRTQVVAAIAERTAEARREAAPVE